MLAALHPDRVALARRALGRPPERLAPAHASSRARRRWYQLLFQFEEAEELLLRDDARLLREWLGGAPDADRYVEELREPGALTARLGLYRANLHPRGELEDRALPPVARADARPLEHAATAT